MAELRVVLVRPQIAANIGATARVMFNFGHSKLVLVRPEADPLDQAARQLSTHGEHLLHSARIVGDLGEAVLILLDAENRRRTLENARQRYRVVKIQAKTLAEAVAHC